ncbi:MAG: SLC13 family permease [Pirellulaceae bacterium]|jgi:di/tricarboxylate transporter|nr:SLC13 family permease [Pirellulaceae bacterium]
MIPNLHAMLDRLWGALPFSQAQFTLGLVAALFVLLTFSSLAPDLVLMLGVAVLLVLGILTPAEALGGLANEGMVTVGILFIIGAGVRETGGVDWIAARLFGRPKTVTGAVTRLILPTMSLSAFMNNTPLVAMLIPAVSDLARSQRIAASKLMIPLSYAAILGGTCTLIGTSTNLVVQSQLIAVERDQAELAAEGKPLPQGEQAVHRLTMFDITWIGLPAAVVGGLYLVFAAGYLLPDRRPPLSTQDDPKEYTVEMQVAADSPLIGKSIEDAGLRHLPGLFLAEIDRDGNSIPAVSPREVLRPGDRLLFVGVVESIVELQRIRGLVPATDDVFHLKTPRPQRCLIEAVVSNTCPLVGQTIRESRFRSTYNAVVVAVARNGQRLHQKIGDIEVHAGDVLLVEAHPSFADQHKNSRDFFLVSAVDQSNPRRHELALVAVGLLVAMVVLVSLGFVSMLVAAMVTAGLMIGLRCLSIDAARRSIDWEVLLAIAASFALGLALEKTGAAKMIAQSTIALGGGSPWVTLAIIYFVTLVVTELITNNAAAALMFPFALAIANSLEVSYLPFVIAVMMAASAGFATPIGYQTNLMVYGPGGYRFSDYLKVGIPLDLLVMAVTVILAPLVFPFK